MVGICSYLLVNFWFTRSYANQSSISAFITNRVGDMFLTVGMFTVAWSFGNKKKPKIKVSKCGCGGSYTCAFKNHISISYHQVRIYSTNQIRINYSLGPYLAGLIEGDGYIGVQGINSKIKVVYRPKIIIAFNINDKPLAEKLSAELKVGKIINREKSGIVLWQILAKEEILKIINFINGNMRTPKIEALHRAIRWINERDGTSIPCLGLDSSPLESNSWLAGFIDGSKSSVGFYLIKQNTRKSVKFIPQFKLEDNLIFSNNENGELINIAYFSILSKISEFCKTSLISRTEHSKYLRLSIKIVVRNSFSLEIIIAYFTKFPLLGKRGVDFLYWKESILKIEKKEYKGQGLFEIKPYNKRSNILYSNIKFPVYGICSFSTTVRVSSNNRIFSMTEEGDLIEYFNKHPGWITGFIKLKVVLL